jgi:hypothetical protein
MDQFMPQIGLSELSDLIRLLERLNHLIAEKYDTIFNKITELTTLGEARMIPDDPRELEEFNEQIINQSTCSMCLVRVVNIKLDCGHLYCSNCTVNINECPMCRIPIINLSNIYLKKYLKYRNKYLSLKQKILLHNKI